MDYSLVHFLIFSSFSSFFNEVSRCDMMRLKTHKWVHSSCSLFFGCFWVSHSLSHSLGTPWISQRWQLHLLQWNLLLLLLLFLRNVKLWFRSNNIHELRHLLHMLLLYLLLKLRDRRSVHPVHHRIPLHWRLLLGRETVEPLHWRGRGAIRRRRLWWCTVGHCEGHRGCAVVRGIDASSACRRA